MSSIYDISVETIDGKTKSLSEWRDQVLLIVNVASQCGFTPQYAGLQKLHTEFSSQGLVIMGFPCNQFGAQEPGSATEIKSFCDLTYHVTFPMFAKVDVNGSKAHPLFEFLKSHAPGVLGTEMIKWNFTKFLVDRKGVVQGRFAPTADPESLIPDIKQLL